MTTVTSVHLNEEVVHESDSVKLNENVLKLKRERRERKKAREKADF